MYVYKNTRNGVIIETESRVQGDWVELVPQEQPAEKPEDAPKKKTRKKAVTE